MVTPEAEPKAVMDTVQSAEAPVVPVLAEAVPVLELVTAELSAIEVEARGRMVTLMGCDFSRDMNQPCCSQQLMTCYAPH